MNSLKRTCVVIFFIASLVFLMGQDGFCFYFGGDGFVPDELILQRTGGKVFIGPLSL